MKTLDLRVTGIRLYQIGSEPVQILFRSEYNLSSLRVPQTDHSLIVEIRLSNRKTWIGAEVNSWEFVDDGDDSMSVYNLGKAKKF